MLCPVIGYLPLGLLVIQARAAPMSEEDARQRRETMGFPSWNYMPGEAHGDPTEGKATDWGYIDGRAVAVDYGMHSEWD